MNGWTPLDDYLYRLMGVTGEPRPVPAPAADDINPKDRQGLRKPPPISLSPLAGPDLVC